MGASHEMRQNARISSTSFSMLLCPSNAGHTSSPSTLHRPSNLLCSLLRSNVFSSIQYDLGLYVLSRTPAVPEASRRMCNRNQFVDRRESLGSQHLGSQHRSTPSVCCTEFTSNWERRLVRRHRKFHFTTMLLLMKGAIPPELGQLRTLKELTLSGRAFGKGDLSGKFGHVPRPVS